MASKKAINKDNLVKLGADQLADLLIDISQKDTIVKRMLKTAIAGSLSSLEAAKEIRKRLKTISRSKSFITWKKKKTVLHDLEAQKKHILTQILPDDGPEALELLWLLLALSNNIFQRIYEDNGLFTLFFHSVCHEIGRVSQETTIKPDILCIKIKECLLDNAYGQYDTLLSDMQKTLGPTGLSLLKKHLTQYLEEYRQENQYHHSNHIPMNLQMIFQEIADLQDDVDEYVSLWPNDDFSYPSKSEKTARRFLKAGRLQEAWDYIEQTDHKQYDLSAHHDWIKTRIDILIALDKHQEAQSFRYNMFEQYLSLDLLKEYLRDIKEFNDFEAEQTALLYVTKHPSLYLAIDFLIQWNAPHYLNQMILKRYHDLDGNEFEILPKAVTILSSIYFLSAILILRCLIDYALDNSLTKRYKYCAQHLKECESLSFYIKDYGDHITHEAYLEKLRQKHLNKHKFWSFI